MKTFTSGQKSYFTTNLMTWYNEYDDRILPWKQEKDPYKIWLSEIILQQTRSEQGLPYYHAFINKYPTVFALAEAPDDEVMRLWQGLGYYARCRNLLAAARSIVTNNDGIFPSNYKDILALKGVGPYTAAAIASFAFDQPTAVVDGNVIRVLARCFGITDALDTTQHKKELSILANELIDKSAPAAYNQAIMDYGAMICKPQLPLCEKCLLKKNCVAYKQDMVKLLPYFEKKIIVKERHFHYFLLKFQDKIFIHQRNGHDIWNSLYELYLVESDEVGMPLLSNYLELNQNEQPIFIQQNKQRLTHQVIHSYFYKVELQEIIQKLDGEWITIEKLDKFPFSKTILSFFKSNPLLLT